MERISVGELLRSGRMPNEVLLLKDEATVPPTTHPVFIAAHNPLPSHGVEQCQSHQTRAMENAVRLGVLVTRSFVNFLDNSLSEGSNQEDMLQLLATLKPDDMFIKIEQNNSPPAGDGGKYPSPADQGKGEIQTKAQNCLPIKNNGDDISSSPADQNDGELQQMKTFILHGMDIIVPPKNEGIDQQERQYHSYPPIQILGKLLYSIFSIGKSPPSNLFIEGEAKTTRRASDVSETSRHSKSPRPTEPTLFSRLIETKSFPISICRLLSDLIDIGPSGTADSPFTSLEEVIQDLEQMISQPQKFLHDPHHPQAAPIFGQVYHGRKEEIDALLKVAVKMMEHEPRENEAPYNCFSGVESIFVSGIAGSGKSALVQTVEGHLSSLGWITIKAKFERGMEHASRGILSLLFDEVISHLIRKKKGGSKSDANYVQRVSESILRSIGRDGLSRLVVFLPSLPLLFDDIQQMYLPTEIEAAEIGNWRLNYALSKILKAVLEQDRFMLISCDDLQWADKTSLSIISNVLVNLGSYDDIKQRCLFIGLYRNEKVSNEGMGLHEGMNPFSVQYFLQNCSNIHTSEVKLSGLSKDDLTYMLMEEFRLPRRIVVELADVVHKKTTGHTLFVMELLNSFISGSVITYSSEKKRFVWDPLRIACIRTEDSAAELIASRFSTLPPESQRMLQTLSCFGMQTDDALLQILDRYQQGIVTSIDTFVDRGILDRGGPLVFAHDLIQQAVYESMSLDQRQMLHLDLGQFVGRTASTDVSPLTGGMDQVQLNDRGFNVSLTSPLIANACDVINLAGPGAISDEIQKRTFAQWNLAAGKQALEQADFHGAFHYFSNGIAFLGEDCWQSVGARLCIDLHEGAVFASYALGNMEGVLHYAEKVTNQVSFEDALEVQQILLRTVSHAGKHEDCISRGVDILRRLNFDIPSNPTPESVMNAVANTDSIASKFTKEQLINLCERAVDAEVVEKIFDAIVVSCFASSSPYLPLVACGTIQFSLQHGICQESIAAFAAFAMLKIALLKDYEGARHWADVVRAMEEKHQSINNLKLVTQAPMVLHYSVDIWFYSTREISRKSFTYHRNAMRTGQVDIATIALGLGFRAALLGGENLLLLQQSYGDQLKLAYKHSRLMASHMAWDGILLSELTGKSGDYFSVFGGSICNVEELKAEAESSKNVHFLYVTYCFQLLVAFWRGDYLSAEEHSHNALAAESGSPSIFRIYQTLFGGLVAFQLFRHVGVGDDQRLQEGKEMIDRMGKWAKISTASMAVFENKWLLLKAEHSASIQNSIEAEQLYKASINSAQDHGNIHELALAYELLGNYYAASGLRMTSIDCYNNAYAYYKQWGATAVAEKLSHKHDLDTSLASGSTGLQAGNSNKHSRVWD